LSSNTSVTGGPLPALAENTETKNAVGDFGSIETAKDRTTGTIKTSELVAKYLYGRDSTKDGNGRSNHFAALNQLFSQTSNGGPKLDNNKISFKGLTIEAMVGDDDKINQIVGYRGNFDGANGCIAEFNQAIKDLCNGQSDFKIAEEKSAKWVCQGDKKLLKLPTEDFFNKNAVFAVGGNGVAKGKGESCCPQSPYAPSPIIKSPFVLHEDNEFAEDLKVFSERVDSAVSNVVPDTTDATKNLWGSFKACIQSTAVVAAQSQIEEANSAFENFKKELEEGAKKLVESELKNLAGTDGYKNLGLKNQSLRAPSSLSSSPLFTSTTFVGVDSTDLTSSVTSSSSDGAQTQVHEPDFPLLAAAVNVGLALTEGETPTETSTTAPDKTKDQIYQAFLEAQRFADEILTSSKESSPSDQAGSSDVFSSPSSSSSFGSFSPSSLFSSSSSSSSSSPLVESEVPGAAQSEIVQMQLKLKLEGEAIGTIKSMGKFAPAPDAKASTRLTEGVCLGVAFREVCNVLYMCNEKFACFSQGNDKNSPMSISSTGVGGRLWGDTSQMNEFVKNAEEVHAKNQLELEEKMKALSEKNRQLEEEIQQLREKGAEYETELGRLKQEFGAAPPAVKYVIKPLGNIDEGEDVYTPSLKPLPDDG
jgi:hypothetical protein